MLVWVYQHNEIQKKKEKQATRTVKLRCQTVPVGIRLFDKLCSLFVEDPTRIYFLAEVPASPSLDHQPWTERFSVRSNQKV